MNPKSAKLTAVSVRNAIIQTGCWMVMSTKKNEVVRMMHPISIAFTAAAPT